MRQVLPPVRIGNSSVDSQVELYREEQRSTRKEVAEAIQTQKKKGKCIKNKDLHQQYLQKATKEFSQLIEFKSATKKSTYTRKSTKAEECDMWRTFFLCLGQGNKSLQCSPHTVQVQSTTSGRPSTNRLAFEPRVTHIILNSAT